MSLPRPSEKKDPIHIFKQQLQSWKTLSPEEIQKRMASDLLIKSLYENLFGKEWPFNSGCLGLEQFQLIIEHALEKLNHPETLSKLQTDGYLRYDKSILPKDCKILPKDFLACSYEIYRDKNEHFILILQPHSKQAMRKNEHGFWERPKIEERKKQMGSSKVGDRAYAIGNGVEYTFSLTPKSDQVKHLKAIHQESKQASRIQSPFVHQVLLGKERETKKSGRTKKMTLVTPEGSMNLYDSSFYEKPFSNVYKLLLAFTSAAYGLRDIMMRVIFMVM